MSDQAAIEASGLVKSYRDVRVLGGIDLLVPAGSVFALLGPGQRAIFSDVPTVWTHCLREKSATRC